MPRAETIARHPAPELDRAEMERLADAFELDAGELAEFRVDRRPATPAWRRSPLIVPLLLGLAAVGVVIAGTTDLLSSRIAAPAGRPTRVATLGAVPPDTARSRPAPTLAEADRSLEHGLLLVAQPGDTLPNLYNRVYQGLTPPPYETVAAMNKTPLRPGSRVVFPAPIRGWAGQ